MAPRGVSPPMDNLSYQPFSCFSLAWSSAIVSQRRGVCVREHSVILTFPVAAVGTVETPGPVGRYTSHTGAPTSDYCWFHSTMPPRWTKNPMHRAGRQGSSLDGHRGLLWYNCQWASTGHPSGQRRGTNMAGTLLVYDAAFPRARVATGPIRNT